MKQIIFFLSILFITNKSFSQDSLIKPSKFSFEAQGGYAKYSLHYRGTFLGLGLKYKYAKHVAAYSSFSIMSGADEKFASWGNVQIKSIYAGTNADYLFCKRHALELGAGLNFTTIRGAYKDTQVNTTTPSFYFQAFTLRTYGMGFHYYISYLFNFTSRFKAGLFFSQEFARGFNYGLSSQYNLVEKYGTSIQLQF